MLLHFPPKSLFVASDMFSCCNQLFLQVFIDRADKITFFSCCFCLWTNYLIVFSLLLHTYGLWYQRNQYIDKFLFSFIEHLPLRDSWTFIDSLVSLNPRGIFHHPPGSFLLHPPSSLPPFSRLSSVILHNSICLSIIHPLQSQPSPLASCSLPPMFVSASFPPFSLF